MRTTFLGILLLLLTSWAQAEEVVKTCNFVVELPDTQKFPTTYQIIKNGSEYYAKTTQLVEGQPVELPQETVQFSEFDVRVSLNSTLTDLNQAEQLVMGTMEFLNTPEFNNFFSVCLDLKAIRHALVYQIGRVTHMGGAFVIEAKGENAEALGSFVAGFIPFACK